ncbi:DNA-protecting protein DprA [Candidatus Saccharibacteria bacterium]|nr:DNA-protecting protein DprA [Candidatus Saccharibacteria bacterium]MBI3338301.1 DNA-protecting protein DprA [Candidatus Saccharibacteria bacterium]
MIVKKIRYNQSNFPEILRTIPSPPSELYVLGDLAPLLKMPRLAVVGSRKVSPYGKQITNQLVYEVASRGVVVISGLAFGVDALAHQATLDADGITIAVLPSHVTEIYPKNHVQLAKRILKSGGVLISEHSAGSPPLRFSFITRNRLVSGLSDGVLITEAAVKSGTLHTANFALEQGKSVMAVPGNITSPLSAGTNNLIKSGAIPVTEFRDIMHALDIDISPLSTELFAANKEESVILDLMKQGITDSNEILALSALNIVIFNQTLTMLEITGKIMPLGAGHWQLR